VRFVHVGHRRREEAPHGSPASWTGPSGPGVETVEIIPDGSILSAAGFRVGAARCGIKKAEGEPDVALIVCDGPASGAGVFTTNSFAAAAVRWNRERLPADDVRAVAVNSGNANACTGERGERDVQRTAQLVAELAGCSAGQVCVASTGIIGHPLPMEKLEAGLREAHSRLGAAEADARIAERAIMTTDTRPKAAAVRSAVGGVPFSVGGMCKGAGMISPHLATRLACLTTDARVAADDLRVFLREAAEHTLNRVTVDGDSSTNDTAIVLASGRSGATVAATGRGAAEFREALHAVMDSLAVQIARDGEGATKLIEVHVDGAADAESAHRIARAESQLVKCAAYGNDPNWGRIVCAIGYSGVPVRPDSTSVHIGRVCVFRRGMPTGDDATEPMRADTIAVRIDLGAGPGEATVRTCDLSEEYVRINAEYPT
jgi:glutamate N-acetyltransferase/amino-acid N-acetyltransferase